MRLAARCLSIFYLSTVGMLAIWGLIPVLFGWHAVVVMSGSMEPRIRFGDLVAASPVTADSLKKGQVPIVSDPARPERLLVHRVVRINPGQRTLITRGDANTHNDSTPVPFSLVHGLGRVLVPRIGAPIAWLRTGGAQWTVLWAGLTGVAAWLAVGSAALPFRNSDHWRTSSGLDAPAQSRHGNANG